jgi:hypothetical protein
MLRGEFMRFGKGFFCILLLLMLGNASGQQQPLRQADSFALEPPADLSKLEKEAAWFTAYIDYLVNEDSTATAVPLKNADGQALNIGLSHKAWCIAADEGTMTVLLANHQTRSFNFARSGQTSITDCSDVLTGLEDPRTIQAINRSLVKELPPDAPFGLGVKNYRLIPYRSVAIDLKGEFRRGDVLYIPQLKKVTITLPDGRTVNHDGYVMAVDKVSACSGDGHMPLGCNKNHIDYFKGRTTSDACPAALDSNPKHPLDVYIVSDPTIIATLSRQHSRE